MTRKPRAAWGREERRALALGGCQRFSAHFSFRPADPDTPSHNAGLENRVFPERRASASAVRERIRRFSQVQKFVYPLGKRTMTSEFNLS